jgi:hypothetical protein
MVTTHVPKKLLREIVTDDLKRADGNETVYIPTK